MRKSKGFTLTELMIAVVVVGVLSAVAIPSYRSHVGKANRSAAQQLLLSAAQKEQQYFLDARSYSTAPDSTGLNLAPPSEQGWTCSATQCANKNFVVTIAAPAGAIPPTFTVTAAATATGSNKGEADLTINQAGAKTGTWN